MHVFILFKILMHDCMSCLLVVFALLVSDCTGSLAGRLAGSLALAAAALFQRILKILCVQAFHVLHRISSSYS